MDLGTHTYVHQSVKLNANRHVVGVLRGFDQFLNIVLDSATDEKTKQELGMVVRVVNTWRCCPSVHINRPGGAWQQHCHIGANGARRVAACVL